MKKFVTTELPGMCMKGKYTYLIIKNIMKKFVTIALVAIFSLGLTSCTQNSRARMYGGTMIVELPEGYKLVEVTWKDANLWYLMEPMEDDYEPKNKIFKEDARLGIVEGEVVFVEHK